jgi:hypothetical protein
MKLLQLSLICLMVGSMTCAPKLELPKVKTDISQYEDASHRLFPINLDGRISQIGQHRISAPRPLWGELFAAGVLCAQREAPGTDKVGFTVVTDENGTLCLGDSYGKLIRLKLGEKLPLFYDLLPTGTPETRIRQKTI